MKKIISILLLISGLSLISYPTAQNLYSDYRQEKLITQWESGDAEFPEIKIEAKESFDKLDEIFTGEATAAETTKAQQVPKAQAASREPKKSSSAGQMIGTIEIKKIGVKLPILEGATLKNMKVGAGHLSGTAFPGQEGNLAIAAHRSRTYGRMFNRLGEIKAGDKIIVKDKEKIHNYIVTGTSVVKPEDMSVLRAGKGEKLLTLITCTPIDTATHRLIIHAKELP